MVLCKPHGKAFSVVQTQRLPLFRLCLFCRVRRSLTASFCRLYFSQGVSGGHRREQTSCMAACHVWSQRPSLPKGRVGPALPGSMVLRGGASGAVLLRRALRAWRCEEFGVW